MPASAVEQARARRQNVCHFSRAMNPGERTGVQMRRSMGLAPRRLGGFLVLAAALCLASANPPRAAAAMWQYYVPFDTVKADKSGQPQQGKVYLWLPPATTTVRG